MTKKTSVNVAVGLAKAYQKKGKEMKKAVLKISPAALTDPALRKLFKKYGIKLPKGAKNLWMNTSFMDKLLYILFPNPSDRIEKTNVKLYLTEDELAIIQKTSKENILTPAFCKLLLLDYAMHQQHNMQQVRENATKYFNRHILRLPEDSIQTQSCYDIKTPHKTITTSNTGLKVHGNKEWFLNNLREILQALPTSVDIFVEPCAGSGIVALEACKQGCFKRIITNDIYWHKANFLRSFFLKTNALKATCLSLKPDQTTYDEAKAVIEKFKNSSTDEILPDVAAKYLFINYCNKSRGGLNLKNILENNKNATEKYKNYLDCLWNYHHSGKKIVIHNEDALSIIKKYNRKKHLLFVDPPYPETKGYETDFSVKDFESIAKATINFNGNFIFCCRITKKHEKIYVHKDTYGIDDLHIKHIIDNPFLGHGLYYRDYLFDKGGVAIERVITNFPFAGCYHYDTEQPWQGE